MLQQKGYSSSLQRTPRWMQEKGCGYSIRVRYQDTDNCVTLLQENQIPYRKVYLLRDNGTAEELTL